MIRTIASLLAVATLATAGAALAEPDTSASRTVTLRIPHGDLDLSTSQGAQVFAARVDSSARQFCRTARMANEPFANSLACEQSVRAEATKQLPQYQQVRTTLASL